MDTPGFGARCEALAAGYLYGKGYRIRARNLRTKVGEVDLLCVHGSVWVFVEVKARHNGRFGPGSASVGARKQRRIVAIARQIMAHRPHSACRFDVVSVAFAGDRPLITHLVDAFSG
jgi:putative endonuclease